MQDISLRKLGGINRQKKKKKWKFKKSWKNKQWEQDGQKYIWSERIKYI